MAQAVELNGKKILVTFLMHLGDLTLTTPFIHALRKAAPDAHITFLADEKLKDVVLRNPYLDEVITISPACTAPEPRCRSRPAPEATRPSPP